MAAGLSTGCNKGKDEVLSDGTKLFGERTLKDGTIKVERIELPGGEKDFEETRLPDGTDKVERVEFANGKKEFDVTSLPDGTQKAARVEYKNGVMEFDVTWLRDGTRRIGRIESLDGKRQLDVTIASETVALLESDSGWIALEKKENGDDESKLREFSPEWNQIQAEIDKEVSSINDPSLRADERRRVSDRLLPKARLYQLEEEPGRLLNQQQTDYLNAHKEDYRIIASFSNEENPDAYVFCSALRCQYPNPVMQVKPDVEGDGILFYSGKQGVIKDINSDTADKWSITEKIEVQTLIRLTVHEMDAVLSKFRDLKAQEINQGAASLAPYSTLVASATGSAAMEDAGYRRATPEQVRATDAGLKEGDRRQAELGVWDRDIVLAAQVDVGKDRYTKSVREGSRIYLVDRGSGTILTEIPKAAFCFNVEQSVSQGIHGDYSDKHKTLHQCAPDPREQ